MDLHVLRSFHALAETKNFRKTASKINLTQAALSLQIQKLENDLKTKLFNRDAKKISLTPQGEIFLGYTSQILELYQEAKNRFLEPMVHGEIRLGIPEDFAFFYLPDILKSFSFAHPQITFEITCDLTVNLIEKFKQGLFDIIMIKQDPDHKEIEGKILGKEVLAWVAHPDVIFQKKLPNPIPLVLSPEPCVYRKRAIDALKGANVAFKINYSSPSYAGNIAAARAGLGITVLPQTMIPDDLMIINNMNLPDLHEVEFTLVKNEKVSDGALCLIEYLSQEPFLLRT
jgi:DNA-binding transcriptional LysR family regulator